MNRLKLFFLCVLLLFTFVNLSAQGEYSISEEQQKEITQRVKLRLCEFHNLLVSLANKEYMNTVDCENRVTVNTGIKIRSDNDARILIKSANRYFAYGDKSLIEVTNSKGEKNKRFISSYLLGLYRLPYRTVSIEYVNIYLVDKIKRGENGLYYGTVVVEQRFTGKGEFNYTSTDLKSFEIIVDVDPDDSSKMDVKFGNIVVVKEVDTNQKL